MDILAFDEIGCTGIRRGRAGLIGASGGGIPMARVMVVVMMMMMESW